MSQQDFNFDKFVEDLQDKEVQKKTTAERLQEQEHLNKVREYYKLYREHPLSRTFVDKKR
jgi:hypothetical protein|tara:strand:- start:522 stop:701 length:180 start_codon:yes stop_codon:yes gene_type:complete